MDKFSLVFIGICMCVLALTMIIAIISTPMIYRKIDDRREKSMRDSIEALENSASLVKEIADCMKEVKK